MARNYTPRYNGPVDVSAVSAEPEARITRSTNVDLTLQLDVLNKSRAQADAKGMGLVFGMNVNHDAVKAVQNRFKAAARELGCGVSFDVIPHGDRRVDAAWNLTPGHDRVRVQARPKRDVKPPTRNGATPVKSAAKKAAAARR